MTPDQQRVIELAGAMRDLQEHPAYNFMLAEIHRLKEAAVESVLNGIEPNEYRRKLGFIEALEHVLSVPGELAESAIDIEKELRAES